MPKPSRFSAAVAGMALGLGVAACGGGASPTVAHLGSTTTTTSASAASGSGPPRLSLTQAAKFSRCMRAHGVPGFPDPTPGPNGGFGFGIDQQKVGANPSQMQSAQQACKSLLPNHGVGPALTAAQQQAFLNWAACIRAHGYPSFPDPDFSGGGVRIRIADPGGGNTGGAAAPSGPPPALQAAQNACKSKMPAGFGKGPGG